jgi:hypothetical protein
VIASREDARLVQLMRGATFERVCVCVCACVCVCVCVCVCDVFRLVCPSWNVLRVAQLSRIVLRWWLCGRMCSKARPKSPRRNLLSGSSSV